MVYGNLTVAAIVICKHMTKGTVQLGSSQIAEGSRDSG